MISWSTGRRNIKAAVAVGELANDVRWVAHSEETLGVAREIYLRLPLRARVWLRGDEFRGADIRPGVSNYLPGSSVPRLMTSM